MILSIPQHMQGIHVFPENEKFKECSHLALPQTGRNKKWLKPGSMVFICGLITSFLFYMTLINICYNFF
jgi:hypothetical protein